MGKKKKPSAKVADELLSASADGMTLCSWAIGALPIINSILDRIGLESFFEQHLPVDGPRMKIPTRRGLRLLIQNILLSREPIYGLGEWAQRHAPDLTGIQTSKLKHLNDDRIGRCLDQLIDGLTSSLVISVVRT